MSTTGKPRLLDHVREVLRLHHYSIHTERAYCAWIRRHVKYHHNTRREDLRDGERKIDAFLTHLAVEGNESPSTQNQSMNALAFLYKQVLKMPADQEINAVRARRQEHVPVVLQREEVAHVIALMEGAPQVAAQLLYGSGLRISSQPCHPCAPAWDGCTHCPASAGTEGCLDDDDSHARLTAGRLWSAEPPRRPRELNAGVRRHNDRDDPC